jgi:methylated-DNA-[protein]-cysteine S-methyltransferase
MTADAVARFVAAAEHQGLVDVAFAELDSPLGPLVAATTPAGLCMLSYEHGRRDELLHRLATQISPRVLEAPARLDPVRWQLDEYFAGQRRSFDLDLDRRLIRGFGARVLEAAAEIPYGATRTYREVAAAAGNAAASRATGGALGANPLVIVVPCHRVLRSDGGLGGYTTGLEKKEFLLRLERASV